MTHKRTVTHRIGERTRAGGSLLLRAMLWGAVPGAALAQASPFMTGMTSLQANIVILRCSGSDSGGTAHFASRLIGDRELLRRQTSRGRDRDGPFAAPGQRRSTQTTLQQVTEPAIMPSEIEQLPDLAGYLKTASARHWRRVTLVY
jgi:hypothetical protein